MIQQDGLLDLCHQFLVIHSVLLATVTSSRQPVIQLQSGVGISLLINCSFIICINCSFFIGLSLLIKHGFFFILLRTLFISK